MSLQKIVVNGYSFDYIGSNTSENQAVFKISTKENFNDIHQAFSTNKGTIQIVYNEKIMQSFNDYTKLISILYDANCYTVTMAKEFNDLSALQIITDGIRPTVEEAKQYRAKVEQIAESVEDKEESLENIWAFPKWESGILYTVGKRVKYAGQLYKVILEHTSQDDWTPDTARALFTSVADPSEEWPYWVQPLGSHDTYPAGAKVSYPNKETENMGYWISDVDANNWEPGVYGWTLDHEDTPVEPDPEPTPVEDEYPEWVQPIGAENAYKQGDKVSHNEQHYISDVDGNVWEPGVYGWTVEE